MAKKGLQGTWPQALLTFFAPFIIFLGVRWCIMEPFVIPSGSMIPTLMVHDHVVVTKYSYGLKVPFTDKWLARWATPHRGDVVVFKYPLNPDVFYIKRLVGLPGDKVEVKQGKVTVNGQPWAVEPLPEKGSDENEDFDYFIEQSENVRHRVRFLKERGFDSDSTHVVPEKNYFFMGDNRDQSSDGRVFGFVDETLIVGPAKFIWLSCEETLQSAQFICNPRTIRWNRLFSNVE
ncbi:MAG: signal peptidase I [Bdellovibrionota bacterium]